MWMHRRWFFGSTAGSVTNTHVQVACRGRTWCVCQAEAEAMQDEIDRLARLP
jgi:hypothetical protein